MKPGTQIAYMPTHANNDISHPDVEFGFIAHGRPRADEVGYFYFCRYWRKGHPGELRTVGNSELTPAWCLIEHRSVPQMVVDRWLEGQGDKETLSRFSEPK